MHYTADEWGAPRKSIGPVDHPVATATGAGVDCQGFREALVELETGVLGGATTVDVTIEESSDDGVGDAYAAVPLALFTQKVTGDTDDLFVGRINLEGRERFLRAVAVVGGAAGIFTVRFNLTNARELPVTQTNASEFQV